MNDHEWINIMNIYTDRQRYLGIRPPKYLRIARWVVAIGGVFMFCAVLQLIVTTVNIKVADYQLAHSFQPVH